MTRVAAFDCGTNSLRLLVADLDAEAGTSEDVVRDMRIVRLGQGVDRTAVGAESGHDVPEIEGISAGGMPDRVKCLHVLAGQSLAQGRGVNPLGDEVLDRLGDWWASGPCVSVLEEGTG